LSRNNLATPNASIALLKFMSRHKEAADFRESLPIAGVDGSLKNRMKNTAAAGNLHAKTGTLRWANSLSGYVTTAAGEPLAFSIMLNRFVPDANVAARDEVDAIAVMLAGFEARSDP
jgi:D-alanyl-D-alanine carboxypeptidase/D-alanyl-D-alanine-endopeptidase (penicillin-binding protein 4)